jgi:hypothetical protein
MRVLLVHAIDLQDLDVLILHHLLVQQPLDGQTGVVVCSCRGRQCFAHVFVLVVEVLNVGVGVVNMLMLLVYLLPLLFAAEPQKWV